jgi:hypothetical protein
VSNLTQTFNKFFKIEKQKALGYTNKAVKDLNPLMAVFIEKSPVTSSSCYKTIKNASY